MGTLYVDTGGSATNSGSTDQNAADLTGSAATVSGSVVTLDGSPDLSALITSGDTQSSIYLNDATNSNMLIFWIDAFDNTAKTVTVSVAPTGITSSAWAIGGRQTAVDVAVSVCRGGDTCIVNNSPSAVAGTVAIFRNAGSTSAGWVKLVGKAGVTPVLTTTNTSNCVSMQQSHCWIENLELVQQGASGNALIMGTAAGNIVKDVKISDSGGTALFSAGSNGNHKIINCEITGGATHGIDFGAGCTIVGCHIHNMGGDGIRMSGGGSGSFYFNNLINSNDERGIFFTSTSIGNNSNINIAIVGNTIYGNGNSGIDFNDVDYPALILNNIFHSNGDSGTEYNFEHPGDAEKTCIHGYNVFYQPPAATAGNLLGITLNGQYPGTELDTDPLLTDPGASDFTLDASSPAKGTGFPGTIGSSSHVGYMDMGALQRQESGGGGNTYSRGRIVNATS